MSQADNPIDMSAMAFEGFGQMMENVQRAWSSSFELPTPFTPAMSLADLDKRIADLRAVEQWLALNQNMLRGTIQGLEIQRGTLHAVQSLSETFGKAVQLPEDQLARFAADAARYARSAPSPTAPPAGAMGASPATAPAPSTPAAAPASPAGPPSPAPAASPTASSTAGHSATVDATNPLVWWDLLQQNFQRLAEAAAPGGATLGSAGTGPAAGARDQTGRAGDAKSPRRPDPAGAATRPRTRPKAGTAPKARASAKAGTTANRSRRKVPEP